MHILCEEAFVWCDYEWSARLQWDDIILLCHSTVWVCLPLSICVWAAAYSWSSFRSISTSLPVRVWALQLHVLSLSLFLEFSMRTSLLRFSSCEAMLITLMRMLHFDLCDWFLHLLLDCLKGYFSTVGEERNPTRTCNNHTVSSMHIWC